MSTTNRAAMVTAAVGAAIGIAGVAVGSVALARVNSPASGGSTSVTATASTTEAHAAAVDACSAFRDHFRSGVGLARGAFIDRVDRRSDWESPESLGVQGYYIAAANAEMNYLDGRISPAAPEAIRDAMATVHRTLSAVIDSDLRREPASASNAAVDQYSAALAAAESACVAAGVG